MTRLVLAVVLTVLTTAVALGAPAPPVHSYRTAARCGEIGLVSVRAYTERLKPDAADLPIKEVVVTLIPYSEALIADLERVKAHARDSLASHRAVAREVRRLEEAYEQSVWEAGAADLVQSSLVGPEGRASFSEVPAGHWILWARHEVATPLPLHKAKKGEKQMFNLGPAMVGYRTARYWMLPLTVSGGEEATMELTDRNVWLTGVIEEMMRQDATP
jgi:hypothetical protein